LLSIDVIEVLVNTIQEFSCRTHPTFARKGKGSKFTKAFRRTYFGRKPGKKENRLYFKNNLAAQFENDNVITNISSLDHNKHKQN